MILSRKRHHVILIFSLVVGLLVLSACGNTPAQTQKVSAVPTAIPTPTLGPGQQLLVNAAQRLNAAKTLHTLLHLQINSDRNSGTLLSEVWNATPASSRSEVRQSTLADLAVGTIFVSDGKQQWQYNPQQKVVFHGSVQQNSNGLAGTGFAGTSSGQSQLVLNLVQNILTQSDGTLKPSSSSIAGQQVADVHVVPQSGALAAGSGSVTYDGDVYISKETQLPVRFSLNIQGLGNIVLDLQGLALNQPVAAALFSFNVPAGAKLEPFPTPTASTGSLSLSQAQQQAGYHLLHIPDVQTAYTLQSVNALGAPGSEIYTLLYKQGDNSVTLAEGKSLANLSGSSGKQITVRGTIAQLSTENTLKTLSWTENGVGVRITGEISETQLVAIAGLLR